jgi:hypothetical protein
MVFSLSKKAIQDLRSVLSIEIGKERSEALTDQEVCEIGEFLLTVFAHALKVKS